MSSYSSVVLSDSPKAYYRLDEASGTTATDSSGNAFNGTYTGVGVTYSVTGAIVSDPDKAVTFNGSSGDMACPSGVDLSTYGGLTIEFWMNLSTLSLPTSPAIVASDLTGSSHKGAVVFINSTATGLNFLLGNGSSAVTCSGSFTFATGTWYHIVCTWNGSTMTIYVNGVSKGTASFSGPIASTTNHFTLAHNPAGTDWFTGSTDEFAVYNAALSGTRVLAHYSAGTTVTTSKTVTETATGTEIVTATSFVVNSVSVVETATGSESATAFMEMALSIIETATGSESVTSQSIHLSAATAQMQLYDLAYHYKRIMGSVTGPVLQFLATVYYKGAVNAQAFYGELDALFNFENIQTSPLHSMSTGNDVTNFLKFYEYLSNVLTDKPRYNYRLNETAGWPTVADIAGQGMTASVVGGVTLGQAGPLSINTDTAALFNGTTGYIQLPIGANVNNWPSLVIEAFINPANITFANTVSIVANDVPSSSGNGFNFQATKNSLLFSVGNGAGGFTTISHAQTFVANTYYLVQAVFTGTQLYILVNGSVLALSSPFSAFLLGPSANPIYIAKNPPDVLNGFPGTIGQVAIYQAIPSPAPGTVRWLAHYNAATNPV